MYLRILMTVMALTLVAPAAFAASNQARDPAEKLTDGIGNVATGWTEIPMGIADKSEDSNIAIGLTQGTAIGTGKAVEKTLKGVADTVTFFVSDQEF